MKLFANFEVYPSITDRDAIHASGSSPVKWFSE